jgi:hypothetical protein
MLRRCRQSYGATNQSARFRAFGHPMQSLSATLVRLLRSLRAYSSAPGFDRLARSMTTLLDWTAVGSIATALAVLVAAWQLYRATLQTRTNFEDDLSREYRKLGRDIPVKAYLGDELTPEEFAQAFPSFLPLLRPDQRADLPENERAH